MTPFWQTLSPPWQAAVSEAWAAWCAGSFPIGAVITDEAGQVIARGRNRFNDTTLLAGQLTGSRVSHAEINALALVDHREVNLRTCTLYTTLEPCPMCTGAIRMAQIGNLQYAARDPIGGSVSLFTASPFLAYAAPQIVGPQSPLLEDILAALHTAFVLGMQLPWQR